MAVQGNQGPGNPAFSKAFDLINSLDEQKHLFTPKEKPQMFTKLGKIISYYQQNHGFNYKEVQNIDELSSSSSEELEPDPNIKFRSMLMKISNNINTHKVSSIDMLKVVLADYVSISALEKAESAFEVFDQLTFAGHLNENNLNILVATIELLDSLPLKGVIQNSGFDPNVDTSGVFTQFRRHIVLIGMNLREDEVKKIASLYAVPKEFWSNQWKLLQYLEDQGNLQGSLKKFFSEIECASINLRVRLKVTLRKRKRSNFRKRQHQENIEVLQCTKNKKTDIGEDRLTDVIPNRQVLAIANDDTVMIDDKPLTRLFDTHFEGMGFQLDKVTEGSLVFHLLTNDPKALTNLWTMNVSEKLLKDLAEMLVAEEHLQDFTERWMTWIDEPEYKAALSKLEEKGMMMSTFTSYTETSKSLSMDIDEKLDVQLPQGSTYLSEGVDKNQAVEIPLSRIGLTREVCKKVDEVVPSQESTESVKVGENQAVEVCEKLDDEGSQELMGLSRNTKNQAVETKQKMKFPSTSQETSEKFSLMVEKPDVKTLQGSTEFSRKGVETLQGTKVLSIEVEKDVILSRKVDAKLEPIEISQEELSKEEYKVSQLYDYMQNDMADSRSTFYDSKKQLKVLCDKACYKKIAQICGGPFSGKERLAREFARKLNASSKNTSFCFKVDLLLEMKNSREQTLEKNLIKFAVEQMEYHDDFAKDIEELEKNEYNMIDFCKFFSRKHRNSNFVFVFYNADVVSMTKEKTEFLDTLINWTSKCRNVFIILTTQFKYTIYDDICLTHSCKPLEIEDAITFLKDEIEIAKKTNTDVVIDDPSHFQCKQLVNLVKCWPFLIRVVAHDLNDYSAGEMIELLTETPLLNLTNEAASKIDQLDSKLKNMVQQLSAVLEKNFFLFAEFPDAGKELKIEEMMQVRYRFIGK